MAESADAVLAAAANMKPEAILLSSAPKKAGEALAVIRAAESLRDVPVLADLSHGRAGLRSLDVEDWVHSHEELASRIEAVLRARRLVERENASRLRLETLLEITQAATSSLELEQVLSIAVEKIGQVVPSDRCSVVLVEGDSPRVARVVASREPPRTLPLKLDLAKYPELRRALETRHAVHVADATRDPLMEEVRRFIAPVGVRSILVQPLICHEDLLGALFLRLSKGEAGFGREEQEFARAVAASLANSIRNARLHAAVRRKREDLESAYVDRYRELIEANKRLKELNRLKDEIIAVCSHDLRAPLQVLLGHGRLLLDTDLEPGQQASTEAVVRMGKKILDLVENLLERGKGQGARLALDARMLDVAELCKETAAELEILASERGVSLRSETPESLMAVGDEVKICQVLQNLIINAIHHAKPSGEVVVRAQRLRRPDGDAARVEVQDDGPGIPTDELHLVFDKFHHGKGGTGLGLAICKDFVELHGGEIWSENLPENGCEMVFVLPLAEEAAAARPEPPPSPTTEQARILVVEDEPEVAAVLAEILRSRYRVEVARDGAEGLAKARGLHPDLVVMDVFLPKMDGLDAAKALKTSTDTSDIPVILLSAHQGVAEKVRALNLGAVDYMAKPFQALELLSRTERALRLRATERDLARSLSMLRRVGSDPETGLLDRSGLLVRLDQELSRSRRYGRALSLAVLKAQRPVESGVRECAALIRGRLRTPDVVAHLGEGSWAVLLPEAAAEAASAIVSRLVPELAKQTQIVFGGASVQPEPAEESADELLERALKLVPGS